MSRRRTFREGKYANAEARLTMLEKNVVHATVRPDFTDEDLVTCLWPAEIVRLLRAAFPVIDPPDRSAYSERVDVTENMAPLLAPRSMHVVLPDAQMCCPAGGLIKVDTAHPAFPKIAAALRDMAAVVAQFDKARQVVDWFEKNNATAGCVRYYFPAMLSLLPPDHAVHDSDGVRFKETTANIAPLLPTIREASDIVAGALLAPTADTSGKDFCLVSFTRMFGNGSQMFALI